MVLKGYYALTSPSEKSRIQFRQVLFPIKSIKDNTDEKRPESAKRKSAVFHEDSTAHDVSFEDPAEIGTSWVGCLTYTQRIHLIMNLRITTYFGPCKIHLIRTNSLESVKKHLNQLIFQIKCHVQGE